MSQPWVPRTPRHKIYVNHLIQAEAFFPPPSYPYRCVTDLYLPAHRGGGGFCMLRIKIKLKHLMDNFRAKQLKMKIKKLNNKSVNEGGGGYIFIYVYIEETRIQSCLS